MSRHFLILLVSLSLLGNRIALAQSKVSAPVVTSPGLLSLEECIRLAQEHSAEVLEAKQELQAAYWRYRTYRAEYLPSLEVEGTLPSFNRRLVRYQMPDGSIRYISENTSSLALGATLSQNLGTLGTRFFLRSDLNRTDLFGKRHTFDYMAVPLQIGVRHSFFSLNELKWAARLEPKRYLQAKREYLKRREEIAIEAIGLFFDLLQAEQNLSIAQLNRANADTLYTIAKGRYNIGTIAENDLLQMELNYLQSDQSVYEGEFNAQLKRFALQRYLGLPNHEEVQLVPPAAFSASEVMYDSILNLAREHSPKMIAAECARVEAKRGIAQAKANRGYALDLSLSYGLTQQAKTLPKVYQEPMDQQGVNLSLQIPILDWGKGKGRVKMAQTQYELTLLRTQQAAELFDQQVFLLVMRYNRLNTQLRLAAKADTIAQNRYRITKARFLVGKVDVLELDNAQIARDRARIAYLSAIANAWRNYYELRAITLYDPKSRKSLLPEAE